MYKSQRNYENAQRAIYNGTGEYQIPEIEPTQYEGATGLDLIMPALQRTGKRRECISS